MNRNVITRMPLVGLLLLVAQLSISQSGSVGRVHERFDANWKFARDLTTQTFPNPIQGWRWRTASTDVNSAAEVPSDLAEGQTSDPGGEMAKSGQDVFSGKVGFAWFWVDSNAKLVARPGTRRLLHFGPVDDNATVFVNGTKVFHHEGWNEPFDIPLGNWWHDNSSNRIVLLVENTAGPGGISTANLIRESTAMNFKQARENFSDKAWRTVHLPHDFVIEGKFAKQYDAGHGALQPTKAWYRKTFTLPSSAASRSVWIDFDGAGSDAHVWLNGHLLGSHRSGYTGFRFSLNKWAKFGSANVLAVHLDAAKIEGWWYEGGGLYRHVWLTTAPRTHIAPNGIFVTADVFHVRTRHPSAALKAEVKVQNDGSRPSSGILKMVAMRPDGTIAGTASRRVNVGRFSSSTITTTMRDKRSLLWSLEKPQLYRLVATFRSASGQNDELDQPFGVRSIRFDAARGFFLNEKSVKLQGTCNHQDFAGVGVGMVDSVLAWRIARLKSMGSNAYRCSHNEVASELLDECDRQGMLVMDENRELGDTFTGKANRQTTTHDLSDLRQLVTRDRNHPSVIMWSIGNEEWAVQGNSDGVRIGKAMMAAIRKLDTTRPISAALNGGHFEPGLETILDLEGHNYNPGDYVRYHNLHPNHPMFGSETASTVTTRGEYADDPVRGYVTAYDIRGLNNAEDAWQPIAEEPYNAGGFVWTGFDYKGEPTPYGWPCVNSHFGILDLCGFPKDAFYYYKAWWGKAPVVHILPHWNWPGKLGKPISVWAYGNGDSVQLTLNGVNLGLRTMPKYRHVEWQVPYARGKLVARSFVNGKLVATDVVQTTGAPYALRVKTTRKRLVADAEDSDMLEVSVVDRNGHVVPYAANLIRFTVLGPGQLAGVGNGDPSCHEPDQAPARHAFHGLALGIVKARLQSGKIRVQITSAGLRAAAITLSASSAGTGFADR